MSWLLNLLDAWILDGSRHFVLASLAGLLGYLPISTTLYAQYSIVRLLTQRKASSGVVYCILFISLLAAFALALASHYALDYFVSWYTAPLGPPLDLSGGMQG